MDFSFSEEQQAISDLAKQILEGQSTQDRLKQLKAEDAFVDEKAWSELAKADLLGVALPEDVGGGGYDFLAIALILEQVGRTVSRVPVLPALVLGALPIAEFGTAEQRKNLLPPVISGESILTAALVEPGTDPSRPTTTARREGNGWVLDGVKICVPAGLSASRILVPAATGEGTVGVFVVDPTAPGVKRERQDVTNEIPEARLELSGVVVSDADVLGAADGGAAIVDWIVERAQAGLCATAIGVCEEALRLTAEYTKTREQFDRPIATFQAVGQRAADAYIDTEAIRLTAWQAAWRIAEGLPAAAEVAIAKYWAAEGGQRVVHAAQHLHGGMGVDRDYPLHRYFLWAKHLELTLGGATPNLLKLGAMLAAEPV
jgi:alkylation response protein AidB-like acyl-CoA dehydrogenase